MDADTIRRLFLHHIEKLVVAIVVLISGLLIYRGLQQEDIFQTHHPDRLVSDAIRARQAIDVDHNDVVLAGRESDFKILSELPPIDPGPPDCIWEPRDLFRVLREDPQLYAPLELQVHGVLAPMAVRSSDGDYPLKHLEDADPIKIAVLPPRQRRHRQQQRAVEEIESDLSDDISEWEAPLAAPAAAAGRRLRNPLGMRPGKMRNIVNNKIQLPVPGIGWFIAGTAAMPYKTLHESYEYALGLANQYDPQGRDQPKFISYQLQRADVTNKPVHQLDEADWIKRDGRRECVTDAVVHWAGFAPEIVPADYRADTRLTMWIPPVMLTDYSTFSLHPRIPLLSQRELAERANKRVKQIPPAELDPGQIEIHDGQLRREMIEPEMGGHEVDAAAAARPRIPPPDYKLIRFYDFAFDRKDPHAPEPGRKYVYRLRVAIEDANFPRDPRLQPYGGDLDPAVYRRTKQLIAKIKSAKDPVSTRSLLSVRWTDWSNPSPAISLPGPENVYLGPPNERRTRQLKVGERLVPHDRDRPTARLVISRFLPTYGTRLPMLMTDVSAGTVLSKNAEFADVVDPITLKVKKLPDAGIDSATTIIDIDGGQPLLIHEEDGLLSPSTMLLFDSTGGLKVHEEVDDQEFYRIESFADQRGE